VPSTLKLPTWGLFGNTEITPILQSFKLIPIGNLLVWLGIGNCSSVAEEDLRLSFPSSSLMVKLGDAACLVTDRDPDVQKADCRLMSLR
jgi:hypothetical protein